MSGKHTCPTAGRTGCDLCVQLEDDLWAAINRYAISVGGDPGSHVYGNDARMQAVADVGTIYDSAARQGPAYETAKELAQMWRSDRTASFELLDRLVQHFTVGGET